MTAVPETGPSFSFSMGAAKGSTYSCTRGARGTEVSRNTLKGREGQTVSKVHLGPPHWKALPSSSWGPSRSVVRVQPLLNTELGLSLYFTLGCVKDEPPPQTFS